MTPNQSSLDDYLARLTEANHALAALLNDPNRDRGTVHTPREIAQQPFLWRKTARQMRTQASDLRLFLESAGIYSSTDRTQIIFAGAGSSDYIGQSVADLLRVRLNTASVNWPTTRMTVAPKNFLLPQQKYLLVHFSRSGNSPESTAVFESALSHRSKTTRQLVITCNEEGRLAQLARQHSEHAYLIVLDEATHDSGLAMTSSFTNMIVAGQGLAHLDRMDAFEDIIDQVARAGEHILNRYPDSIAALAGEPLSRAFYLGNNDLLGGAVESALKVQELTAGEIIAKGEDTLAFRHGPISAVDGQTVLCFFLSNDPSIRRYETDVLEQFDEAFHEMGARIVTVGTGDSSSALSSDPLTITYGGSEIPPYFQVTPAVLVGQLFGLFAAYERGYNIDDPSEDKALYSRTVQGVKIYT